MKELQKTNTINSTCYVKFSKYWLNKSVFIIRSGNILHSFIVRAILSVYDPDSERVRANLEQPEAEVQ